MKWVALGSKDQEVRFQTLSEYLTKMNIPNELEFLYPKPDDFFIELEKLVLRVDHIRLQSPYSDRAHIFQNRSTDIVNVLGSADCLIKHKDGGWWAANFLYEAFTQEFVKHVKNLNLNTHVLVVGSGSSSKVAMAALMKLGFSRFHITDRFEDRARQAIDKLKKRFFNVEFNFIDSASLMLLPGSSSVLINGTPLILENTLLKDLYYFNFLKLPATIIDLTLTPPETPLIEEARKIGAQVICGFEIASSVDVLWAKSALNVDLDLKDYREFLNNKLSAVPFDPIPYRLS